MKDLVFITGNQSKADYLAKYLGFPIEHQKLELDEIQSLGLKEVVDNKVTQAYNMIKSPVLVEDVSLEFEALGRLPGTFIKFYVDEVSPEIICRTLDGLSRKATAKCMFGIYDGHNKIFFESKLSGTIAEHPAGNNGYGWDTIFIPEGYSTTRASLSEADDKLTYLKIKPFDKLKTFLSESTIAD